eukprot:7230837-Lingulodinium_polyedra.AAC.1
MTERSKVNVVVWAASCRSVEYRKNFGIPWPVVVYHREKGCAPQKHAIKTHIVSGSKVRGVLMDKSEGCPAGAIELWHNSTTSVAREGALATTDT